jgi:hypothetical protein
MLNTYSIAQWLRDGSGKHGEDQRAGLCRTCSVQPEMLINKGFETTAPKGINN